MLVEDEDMISEPLSIVLRTQGYTVDVAENGKQALALCKKHSYDLILLDIMMPVMDGIEFMKRAVLGKSAPRTKIIVLSNLAMGAELKQAMELGADESILKANITPTKLLEIVGQHVHSPVQG